MMADFRQHFHHDSFGSTRHLNSGSPSEGADRKKSLHSLPLPLSLPAQAQFSLHPRWSLSNNKSLPPRPSSNNWRSSTSPFYCVSCGTRSATITSTSGACPTVHALSDLFSLFLFPREYGSTRKSSGFSSNNFPPSPPHFQLQPFSSHFSLPN